MKKNVNIRIKEIWHNNISEIYDMEFEDDEENFVADLLSEIAPETGTPQIEFTTCAVLEKQNGGISITYEESELTGMTGVVTQLFITDDGCVSMARNGEYPLNLVFEKDKNYICPNGTSPFLVTTRELKNSISEDGGSLGIAYTVNIGGSTANDNEFNIDVL